MKLNLGCGNDYREGYVNVDFSDVNSVGEPIKVDLVMNLIVDEFPFEGEQEAEEVIFRECLEHFNRHNGFFVLTKIYNIMDNGGLLDISVPNAKVQMAKLLSRMNERLTFEDFDKAHQKWTYWKWHDDLMGGTKCSDGLDGDSHKTLYSKNALLSILEHVGFKIESVEEGSSICVKARKP